MLRDLKKRARRKSKFLEIWLIGFNQLVTQFLEIYTSCN
jgi:hypothetical protein